ncbi:HugZ family protein [Nitratireductor basaltis]|uniref:Pyridoxamine 5'-phosphate oxidase-related, FMN-binding protein n=1 Tax=Nitratireductor basaltis TaxID=472175 RepID=A0A084U8Z7_9HYPH|nr:pyridoxamine 5'-phosphate oxidase family protein [Nitratireductor basaltis]KFB09433.1 Pyridoxamine 5'-phosphate oxidase-related, FMN-binding protein [Nitratireductor basaltis]
MTNEKPSPIRPTDAEAIALARRILRMARFGALATLDENGLPQATRVALATEYDAAPLLLISELAAHTRALAANPACALLVGEPGKGDPLAHPRLSLKAEARKVDATRNASVRLRYLARQPKAALYIDFADFAFYRLEPVSALLNGGFGKAYELGREELLVPVPSGFEKAERIARDMLSDEAIQQLIPDRVRHSHDTFRIGGIDPEGVDLVAGDRVERVPFANPVRIATDLPKALAALQTQADRT